MTRKLTIAITGTSGFIGSEVLKELDKRDDIDIIALTRSKKPVCEADNDPSCAQSEMGNAVHCEWRYTDYSYESLKSALGGVDVVIHLAGVRGTENNPEKFAWNVSMTDALLRAMQTVGATRIIFASSMSVYNDDSLMPWTEDIPLGGRSPYGDSKAACERLIREISGTDEGIAVPESHITYGIARIAQVLGEGEKRRGMMNVFIDTARERGTLKVMGRSVNKKQYIYVGDLAELLVKMAIEMPEENIICNVGMSEAYTNLEIAEIVNDVFENPNNIEYEDSYVEKGRPFLMDVSRMRDEFGYEPHDMRSALQLMRKQEI